jgi:hypothetical protein
MTAVVSDQDVFQQFTNAKSRKQYQRTWYQFVVCCWVFLCVVVCCCVLGAVCEQVLRGGGGGWLLGLFLPPPHHYSQVYMGACCWGGGLLGYKVIYYIPFGVGLWYIKCVTANGGGGGEKIGFTTPNKNLGREGASGR